MKVFEPRRTGKVVESSPPGDKTDKTDKTPPSLGFVGFVTTPPGGPGSHPAVWREALTQAQSMAGAWGRFLIQVAQPKEGLNNLCRLVDADRLVATLEELAAHYPQAERVVIIPRQPLRDPPSSDYPTGWSRVPELPPKGQRVEMTDDQGYGTLYRVRVQGSWYLVKFLPPFDGRLSLTDTQGRVRVFLSLDEAAQFLATGR